MEISNQGREHVVITGATGFIGPRIVREALDRPEIDQVTIFIRKTSDTTLLEKTIGADAFHNRVNIIYGDVSSQESVEQALAEAHSLLPITTIINAAGLLMGSAQAMNAVNFEGPKNLLLGARTLVGDSPLKFIQSCSLTTAGKADVFKREPDQPLSEYAASKQRFVEQLRIFNRVNPHNNVIPVLFRPSVVVGAGDSALKDVFDTAYTSGIFLVTGGVNFQQPFVSVDTVAKAMVAAAADNPETLKRKVGNDPIYYLEDGHFTWEQIMTRVSEAMHEGEGERLKPLYVPKIGSYAVAAMEEGRGRLQASYKPRLTFDKLRDAYHSYRCDGERARRDFNIGRPLIEVALKDQHQSYLEREMYGKPMASGLQQVLNPGISLVSSLSLMGAHYLPRLF